MQEMLLPILIALVLAFWVLLIVKFLRNKLALVKTVKAVVVEKTKVETACRYSGTGKRVRYCVVFEAEGKRRAFYVSQFSYEGYRLHEPGTLKYKGDRLIDFS